jgi:hypothetical protein
VEVEVGLSLLLLHPGPVGPGAYHCAITVPEDRFAEPKAWLRERVSLLERDGLDEFALGAPWNSQSLYFAGPDGILLELIARHDLATLPSSGRFTSADCCGSGRPWFPTTTVTPSLGPIAVTIQLPRAGKSLALTANCRVKAA